MTIYGARLISPGTCELQREGRPIEARRVCVHRESLFSAIREGCAEVLESEEESEECRIEAGVPGITHCCPQAVARDVAEVTDEMRGDPDTPLWVILGEPEPDKPEEQQSSGGFVDWLPGKPEESQSSGGFVDWLSDKFGGQQPHHPDPGMQIWQVVNREVSQVTGTLEEAPPSREREPEVQSAGVMSALPWVFGGLGVLLIGGIFVGLVVRERGEEE